MDDRIGSDAVSTRFIRVAQGCATASIAIGVLVLVGWALDVGALKSVVPGLVTMKPNAAVGFLLCGAAIWHQRRRRLAAALAVAVIAISGLTLVEYLVRIDLGIDEILARSPPGDVGSLSSGRMHPTTAFDFLLIGGALLLITLDWGHRAAHAMSIAAAVIAGSALIGYAYGVRMFVRMAAINQMAVHTASGMIVLATGVLLLAPGRGLMRAITDDTEGGVIARRLLPVAILLPFTLDGLALLSQETRIFDERFAIAARVSLTIALFLVCILWTAHVVYRIDRDRLLSNRSLRVLTDAMPQIVWTARPDGQIDYINGKGLEYTGMNLEQVGHRGWDSTVYADDLPGCINAWHEALCSVKGCQIEARLRRGSDGSYRWHLARAEPIRDENGRVLRWFGTCTDIHDQRMASDQRFRSLVEATTAIVWNTPASGEFESEQLGWSKFTGQTFDQLKGWGWLNAVHLDDRPNTARVWSEAVASRSMYEVEHRIRRHDGEYRHMMVRAVPILSADGAIHEWVGVHTDVDVQRRAEVAMREAKEAAEAATRAKGEFLANMSHEIRTPMNGILGMTELALGTDLTPRQHEYLTLVKSSADALLTVINDILDFSKIEAGKLTLDPMPFDVRDSVTDTLRTLAIRAHGKGLELACRIAPDVPDMLVGDQGRLRQILVNLVGNAIKFTERGEVLVTVAVVEGSLIQFAVADTGIGIPDAKKEAVFAAFEQADGSTTRRYGGTGLGLTISSRLVDLMGGRIWVEDHPGGGSVFVFTVRLEMDGERRHEPRDTNPALLYASRILIVDDNRTNRLILEEILAQWGCRSSSAEGGAEALKMMAEAHTRGEPFELLLLDRMMPEMDGCTLAGRIVRDPRLRGTRMLMLTSGGSDESGRFRELGIEGWLSKPIRQSELHDAMLDLLHADAPSTPIETPKSSPENVAPQHAGRRLRILLADDHLINQKVAARMLEQQGHVCTIVEDGKQAVAASEAESYDVILMDVQMPEMDGFEAVLAIRERERERGGRTPIVALTAHAMAGDRDRCLSSGFDDYLAKPIQAATLRDLLDRIARKGV